jgi:CxxC motif-containing protein
MIKENQRLVRVRTTDSTLTCIVCPIGCELSVDREEDGSLSVSGNRCNRGAAYAREEFNDPRRIITGTCAVEGGVVARVPVRSSDGVPVDKISSFLVAMYELRPTAPISIGTVLAKDVAGTGVDLLATMTIPRATEEE